MDEGDRSWCSSNAANDNQTVTIEYSGHPAQPYTINQAVMDSLIKLCSDTCQRNGISQLVWSTYKNLCYSSLTA